MSGTTAIEIIITLLLIIANGFFSGSEIAIVSARRGRLKQRADAGKRAAQQALSLTEEPDRFLATVQIGITLISTLAAAFGGARISESLAAALTGIPAFAGNPGLVGTISFAIVVTLITYFTLILGELVPKRLGLQHAEDIAVRVAPFMSALARTARPIIALLSGSSNLVLRLLRQQTSNTVPVTEEDILYITQEGATSGTVEAEEAQFIRRAFRFTDRIVRQVMTPRSEIVAVEVNTPISEVIQTVLASGYSRLPVYEETLDQVLGFVHVKDLLQAREQHTGADDASVLRQIVRPAPFVLEHQPVSDLLPTFQQEGMHMALVSDEYGQVTGLVTLEDLLEELVGDIADEHDVEEGRAIVRREDGTWLVDGTEAYESVREQVKELPPMRASERGEYTSLAGVILARLGRIPNAGDSVRVGNVILEVVDMDERRIDKVLIRPAPAADDAPDSRP